jgi:hypothetical protein
MTGGDSALSRSLANRPHERQTLAGARGRTQNFCSVLSTVSGDRTVQTAVLSVMLTTLTHTDHDDQYF